MSISQNNRAVILALKDTGLSTAKSKRVLQAVARLWAQALRRGETVEIPGGELVVEASPPKSQSLVNVRGRRRLVFRNRQAKQIVFRPDKECLNGE